MSTPVVQKPPTAPEAPHWAGDLDALMEAYRQAGGDPEAIMQANIATLVVSGNQVLIAHDIEGLHFEVEELPEGIRARISVDPGVTIERLVHLCFGVLPAEGRQEIIVEYDIGAGARAAFLAHCTFPNAVAVEHVMDAGIRVGAGATMKYTESHFHGAGGGVVVLPKTRVDVAEGGRFITTFGLTRGRVGRMEIDYDVDVAAEGLAELTTKVYGHGADDVAVRETVRLNGPAARGLTKTRVAVREQARSRIHTAMEGNAPHSVGHMDCTEIVRDDAEAENVPVVVVRDDEARVTHEAAIGTVNKKELETLMSRGLDEDEAVDVIIRGMLT
jgi:uncharacterized protein